MKARRMFPYLVLLGGLLMVSTASILIRFTQGYGVSSLSIAAGRLVLAVLILTPIAWSRAGSELRGLKRRDLCLALLSGAFLAAHFASWITSLAYTSVASSAALVATNPLWVGLASVLLFHKRLGRAVTIGIGLTVLGSILIAFSDSGGSEHAASLFGDALALIGALAGSGYFLLGQVLRRHVTLLAYIWLVYTSAAVLLVATALLTSQQVLGYPPIVYAALLGLAIGPQLLGHTSFNWALKYLSATFIAVVILGEPVGSAILAFFLFHEVFAPIQMLGFTVLLIGIGLAALGERAKQKSQIAIPDTILPDPEVPLADPEVPLSERAVGG